MRLASLVASFARCLARSSQCAAFFGSGAGKDKAQYVVVLTKADKNDKRGEGKVSEKVVEEVRGKMREAGVGGCPIILTSAETKMGRDDVWRYLRIAAEAGGSKG